MDFFEGIIHHNRRSRLIKNCLDGLQVGIGEMLLDIESRNTLAKKKGLLSGLVASFEPRHQKSSMLSAPNASHPP